MNSYAVALIAFVCIFGGALLGFVIQYFLPEHHLSANSKDTVKLGAGLIATMAALVLGLLVASAKGTFDTVNAGLMQSGAKIILLDRVLANYGPETDGARAALKSSVQNGLEKIWPEDEHKVNENGLKELENSRDIEKVTKVVYSLKPTTPEQSELQTHALQLCSDLLQARWLLIEEQQNVLPRPLLIVAVFWLSILNVSFGLFAPRNLTVLTVLFACSISVSGAIFLLVEMDTPLDGTIKVSSAPMHKALEDIGR
ncbi:MAG: hypothetical protein ABI443_02810 [Chthoniobacterales bacterium]